LPRSWDMVSGLPPGVFSQAVMPVNCGAGPQFTSCTGPGLHLVSEVAFTRPSELS
jgi:hypothetical protein